MNKLGGSIIDHDHMQFILFKVKITIIYNSKGKKSVS